MNVIKSDKCLFCEIINKTVPANIIEESKTVLAFRDINPQANTHILIIPKLHIPSTREINQDNISYLVQMVLLSNKIAEKEDIKTSGYRWVINTGDDGGQTVNHLHLHLIGGRKMHWPPG